VADPHCLGDLWLGQVEEIAQHQRFALPFRQLPQRSKHLSVFFTEQDVVLGRGRVCGHALDWSSPVSGLGPELRPASVHHAGANVLERPVGLSQLTPAAVQPDKSVLDDILGGRPTTEHHNGEPDQADSMGLVQGGDRALAGTHNAVR
jgi:hypothetical protein